MYGLNFKPAPLTHGGLEYEIFGELSEPRYNKCVAVGQVRTTEGWRLIAWDKNGGWLLGNSPSELDLIPAETHAWGNVYVDEWHASPNESHNSAKDGRLSMLHRITCGDDVRYEYQVVADTPEAKQCTKR